MKITKCILRLFIIQIIFFTISLHGDAFEKPTHFIINEYIAKHEIGEFSLDEYLKEQLGFQEGIEKIIAQFEGQKIDDNPPTIFRWLGYGGKKEDEPIYTRSFRHFHNPLKSWDEAGLKGLWDSSVIWAQRTNQWPGSHYSWQDVRDYFHLALTSKDQTTRDYYFAETFRGLGQQMHLVEDASVPLHTRDDIHIIFNYEGWIEKFRNDEYRPQNQEIFNGWLSDNIRYNYNKSVLNIVANPLAPIPIARIIDTDKYNGNNSDVTIYESIGIAEYSNANFFSNDTAFTDFEYPNWDNIQVVDYDIEDPRDPSYTVKRPYYWKNINPLASDGDTGYRLATVGYLSDYVKRYFPAYIDLFRGWEKPALDANVYRDYAERLIPRAVGYAAGLLDYFFRGTIEITAPDRFVYSITDGSIVDGSYEVDGNIIETQTFNYIKAKLRNTSEEEMGSGTPTAVAKYKRRTDYKPDLSADPPTPESREADFSYSVSQPINIASLDSGYAKEFTFDFSNDPIPASITDLYLQVVFKGILGNETGTAIAVGMKDINEPQHILMVNSTDRVYLNHTLYTADQVRNNPDLVGLLEDEYLDPYDDMDIGMAFYLSSFPTALHTAGLTMQAPGYGRAIILADEPYFYYYVQWASPSRGHADFGSALMAGVINQENSEGGFDDTQVQTFRGINAHLVRWVCWTNPDADGIMSADWPTMESEQPYALGIWP